MSAEHGGRTGRDERTAPLGRGPARTTTPSISPPPTGAGAGNSRRAGTPLDAPLYLLATTDEGRSPTGSPHLFKATASQTAGRFDFMSGSFSPMTGPPLHFHHEQDDTFYILEGVLTVQVGDDIFDISPGDFLSIPPRTPHTFENLANGDKAVRAINLMTPGGLFDMFDDLGRLGEGPDQAGRMAQVAARHGTVIAGPPLRVRLGLE